MVCPKCKSENVSLQVIAVQRRKHHSIIYWIFIGWWLEMILWLFFTIPRLIVAIFRPKRMKTVEKAVAVCQNCGYRFNV